MAQQNRKTSRSSTSKVAVADVVGVMDDLAPTFLAQQWDNVGLLAGDLTSRVQRMLLCIDLTQAVVEEAVALETDLVLAYHPPVFKPMHKLCRQSEGTDALVFQCIRHGIAIYSTHTALDAADGGTNDVLAEACGLRNAKPLEFVADDQPRTVKLVVFVPADKVDAIANAMFDSGAGRIGDYTHCSYRLEGHGTFFGHEATSPTIGQRGRLERIEETRLESIVPAKDLPAVLAAMRKVHPYDEPAYDVYPLEPTPVPGIGREGPLANPTALKTLAKRLRRFTGGANVQTVGDPEAIVSRAVIVAGAAGQLPFALPLGAEHVIVTGEIRHHDALTIDRIGCRAIALGHWASERPALASLAKRLQHHLKTVTIELSKADCDPFSPV